MAQNTIDKTVQARHEILGTPFYNMANRAVRLATRERPKTSKQRTLSIVDKDGVSLTSRNNERIMSATMKSEYASNYTHHSRATSAHTFSTANSKPSRVTRESIVNQNRILQPDSFKELIEGEYTR